MITGTETLTIQVVWESNQRRSVQIVHTPVMGQPTLVVSGQSMNDVMKTLSHFFDYELELSENSYVFKHS